MREYTPPHLFYKLRSVLARHDERATILAMTKVAVGADFAAADAETTVIRLDEIDKERVVETGGSNRRVVRIVLAALVFRTEFV